jgi:hypothetical protein
MNIRHSATKESLFRACTAISLGNGKKVSFWHDKWLQGECPKDIAPRLYKLAWQKNISVAEALHDRKWSRGLQRITSTEDINNFVGLWKWLREVTLSAQEDAITWRFSSNGIYSSSSAYNIQFLGSTSDFIWAQLWRAKTETKMKFFCWLVMQNKLRTADRILKHGGQTNHTCQLYHIREESALHMLFECSYSTSVWRGLRDWVGVSINQQTTDTYQRLKS